MVSGKDRSCQVVEGAVTHFTEVALAGGLCFVASIFDDFGGVAVGTFDPLRPAQVANHLITFGVIDQSVNVNSHHAENVEA